MERFKEVKGIAIVEFNQKDIVRHPLVSKIVTAYNKE
jgi:phosphate starvation-inducible PhoH-like protein